jgi:glyoxylase-like metal-dependent hydrolase (beta-lactamase superfamily II)
MPVELIHEIIPVGPLECNCSILGDPITHEALVVDPGDDVETILGLLRKHGLKVRAIISTHTHIDHVGGLAQLHAATGAPVLIHEADMPLYGRLDMQAQFLGVPVPPTAKIDEYVKDGDTVRWGGYTAQIIHTPGHTPGSIALFSDVARREDKATGDAAASPLVCGAGRCGIFCDRYGRSCWCYRRRRGWWPGTAMRRRLDRRSTRICFCSSGTVRPANSLNSLLRRFFSFDE